jgi:zinc protease
VINEQKYAASGIIEWTLSNGARVFLKSTDFNPDELFIYAHSLGGTSLLPDSLALSPGRIVGMLMTSAGGLGDASRDQLVQKLNTTALKEFNVSLNYTDEQISLGGSPKELETLFQMMHLQFTDPKIDTAAFTSWKRYGYETLTQSINDQISSMLSRGNPRLMPPVPALVEALDLDQAMRIYRHRFGDASDFTFTIVGAADPARVKVLVERYIASLPSTNRTEREQPKDPEIKPLNSIIRETSKVQVVPRTTTLLLFDGVFATDPDRYLKEYQQISAVTDILRRRLRNELREHLGGTYGVSVFSRLYTNPKEHFQVTLNFDADPVRADTLIRVMFENLDSVRDNGVTVDELSIVETIQRRRLETQLNDNRYWLRTIQAYNRLGIPLDLIVTPFQHKLSSDDIRLAAQRYLPRTSFIQLTYLPKKGVKEEKEPAASKSGSSVR